MTGGQGEGWGSEQTSLRADVEGREETSAERTAVRQTGARGEGACVARGNSSLVGARAGPPHINMSSYPGGGR